MTEYSVKWCAAALAQLDPAKADVIRLFDADAVKGIVETTIDGEPRPTWFVHYDHGSEYVMWGDDEQPIINLDNLEILAGMRVFCMNCSSGKGLGTHAREKKILEYLGYMDPVSFTTDAADEFGEVLSWGLIEAINGEAGLKDVVEPMRQHGYDVAEELSAKGQILAAGAMVQDMNILHVFYEGGPDPPQPTCGISRLLLKLGGWNFLWFWRMLRQKISPERWPG